MQTVKIVAPVIIGALGALLIAYGIAAFVCADIGWMRGVFTTWVNWDRAFLLLVSWTTAALGGLIGAAIDEVT